MNHIVRSTRAAVIVGLVVILGTIAGCLPLPPSATAALCPADPTPTYPLPPADQQVFTRLLAWPRLLSVALWPIITVHLPADGADEVTALRAEFGSTIDIEVGNKRLAGGPTGAPTCVLTAPRWATWRPAPRGVDITVTPWTTSADRHRPIGATIRVVNHTRRTIKVQRHLDQTACGPPLEVALSGTDTALAANVSDGVRATDDPGRTQPRSRTFGTLSQGADGQPIVIVQVLSCLAIVPQPLVTLRPGATTEYAMSTTAVSAQPADDPYVTPGNYDLRPAVNLVMSTAAGAPTLVVAAPPARITLHG